MLDFGLKIQYVFATRLKRLSRQLLDLGFDQQHAAREMLSCLNQSVSDFTHAAALEDDYTLIVMKVGR